jgi:hypothetical protein
MTQLNETCLAGDGRSDDTERIQSLLDEGRSAVYLPPPPVHYVISRPLRIHSNQQLVLDRFTVIRLAPKSDCLMITNDDHATGNENISVVGGIWDMDNLRQSPNPLAALLGENPPRPYDPERYLGICMRFVNVRHFTLRSLTFRNPVVFCTQFARMTHFTVDDIVFDYTTWNPIRANMDGIHLDGHCRFGRISNLKGATNDDLVALNADDNENESPCFGPIEDITIDGLYAEGCHSAVRILSSGSPIRRINISNVFGTYYKYAVGITQFFRRRGTVGCFDQISLRDFFCSKAPDPSDDPRGHRRVLPLVWCEEATRTGTLSLHGMHRDERQLAAPCIAIDRGASVDCLVVDHLTCRNMTGKRLAILSNNGYIGRLVAGNLHGVAGSGEIALFDRTASGVIGSREIGACEGMDTTGSACAALPDFLRPREGLVMSDYTVSHGAFSGGVPAVADAEADEGRAFVVPAGKGSLIVSARAHPADHRDSQALDLKKLMVNEGGYAWLACGDFDLYFRDEEIEVTFGAGASDRLTLRMACGVADRYRLWIRVKSGRSESGQRAFFVARVVLEQLAPWREAHPLLSLNEGWQFKTDPKNIGEQEKWFASGPDATWQAISIAAPWTMQGHHHNGAAWYANSFPLPERLENGPVWLVFHAVDGGARVWINGKEAGAQEQIDMWCLPWALDIGPLTKSEGTFQIVMRVEKDLYDAGIFKPVELRVGTRQ